MGGTPTVAGASPALPLTPQALSPPPVLWVEGDLAPITSELTPILEDWDKESLMKQAKELGPDAEKIVGLYQWNEHARTALQNRSAALGAKYLNRAGVSAENKEEVAVVGALLSIVWGRQRIAKELSALRELKEKALKEKKPDADSKNN